MTRHFPLVALSAAIVLAGFVETPFLARLSAQTAPKAPVATAKPQTAKPAAKPNAKPAVPAKPAPAAAKAEPAPEPPPPPPSDIKIVTAYTQDAQVFQNTTYVKGARQRVEFPGMVSLDQCDLQRVVVLNPSEKRFRIQPYAPGAGQDATPSTPAPSPSTPFGAPQGNQLARGGVVTITTTLTDTLERQTLFGLEARRIKTLVTKTTDGNACDKNPMRSEIDAWYIDLPKAAQTCTRPSEPASEPTPAAGECRDRVETRVVGDVSMGFPVKTTTTTTTGEGEKQETATRTAEVTGLEITRLDQALFDVPSDYVAARSSTELMPAFAAGASLEDALFGSTADGTSQAAPKKAGVTRVGVLEPVDKSGRSLNTRMLRQELTGKFSKGGYEALPLSGSSAAAIEADARRLEVDYILLAEVTELKTSKPGRLGGALKMASGGGPPKDVHETKVNYKLFATGATASPRASGDVKASSGGGFGLGSALRVASFAGQMYLGMYGMRGGLGMLSMNMGMNPMSMLASTGGLGAMGASYFDPRAAAMTSMAGMGMSMFSGAAGMGMQDPSQGEMYQTVGEAFGNAAKAATDKIRQAK